MPHLLVDGKICGLKFCICHPGELFNHGAAQFLQFLVCGFGLTLGNVQHSTCAAGIIEGGDQDSFFYSKGDFGISFLNGASVTEKIVTRLPVTLELTLLAMLIAVAIALPMGVLSATHRNSAIDAIASFISMIGVAVPHFWLAMMLIIIFSVNLHWLPASGFTPISQGLGKNLIKMIMPAFSVGLGFAATVMRQTRSNMIDVLGTDYISTAKAKGMSKSVVVWKHGVRNALIPVITVIGMQTGRLFGGAIVVETLFGLPGIGTAIVQSIFSRDYQMTMGCVMMVAVIIILINTIVDILYVIIDPRVRTTRKSGAK